MLGQMYNKNDNCNIITISVEYQGEWPIYGVVVGVVLVPYTDVNPGMSLMIESGPCITDLQIREHSGTSVIHQIENIASLMLLFHTSLQNHI